MMLLKSVPLRGNVQCQKCVCKSSISPSDAGAWSEDEAYTIYREKLVRLRSLYSSQLTRMKHSLAERRREFLMEWTAAGGDREEGKKGAAPCKC